MTNDLSSLDLSELVAEARRSKLDDLHEAIAGPVPLLEMDREPAPSQTWFPELVRRSIEDVKRGEHAWLRPKTRRCSELILGPGHAPEAYDELAKRHAIALVVNRGAIDRPVDCAGARVSGDGLETVRNRSTGVVIAFLHSGVLLAHGVWSPRFLDAGSVFLPGWPSKGKSKAMNASTTIRLWYEHIGVKFVERKRGLEVFRELLREGDICGVPVDIFGVANGTLLGREVRTSRIPAVLAKTADVPLVLVGSFFDESDFELKTHTFESSRYDSIAGLHQAIMAIFDKWLRERPEQLLVPFPAAELARKTARVTGEAELARRAELEAADSVFAAAGRVKSLKAENAPDADRDRAGKELEAALADHAAKRREHKVSSAARKALVRETYIRFD